VITLVSTAQLVADLYAPAIGPGDGPCNVLYSMNANGKLSRVIFLSEQDGAPTKGFSILDDKTEAEWLAICAAMPAPGPIQPIEVNAIDLAGKAVSCTGLKANEIYGGLPTLAVIHSLHANQNVAKVAFYPPGGNVSDLSLQISISTPISETEWLAIMAVSVRVGDITFSGF